MRWGSNHRVVQTHVVTISRPSIKVIGLLERHMGVGDDSGVMLVVVAVRMRQEAVQDEGVTGLGLDGHEIVAVLAMLAENWGIDHRIVALGVGVQLFADPCESF